MLTRIMQDIGVPLIITLFTDQSLDCGPGLMNCRGAQLIPS